MKSKLANWPAPDTVKAVCTTRLSGFSQPPYDGNNLGLHVGDNEEHVLENRRQLLIDLQLPGTPQWLNQTHSTRCVVVESDSNRDADAAITRSKQHPLVILTADCLPILLCNRQGTEIAAIHAGWRGLVQGIVENTLAAMHSDPKDILAWIGPAICQNCFEVGAEVHELFTNKYSLSDTAFKPAQAKWLANLPEIAATVLNTQGVQSVYQSGFCTFESEKEFYSYRRTAQTGRIGSLIWLHD